MIVFDITNAESFTKAKSWVKELQRMGNPNMIMSLAGNKADLAEQRAVSAEDAKVCHAVRGYTFWSATHSQEQLQEHCLFFTCLNTTVQKRYISVIEGRSWHSVNTKDLEMLQGN